MSQKTKSQLEAELKAAQARIAELEQALTPNVEFTSASESDERFIHIFAASPSQMALTDTVNGTYVEVNEAFLRSLGFTREEVIGQTALSLNLFVNPAQRAELLQRMAAQGYLRDEHVLVRAKTGEIRQGIFSAEYLHIHGQKFLLTVMNDVTEKMKAEERWRFALEGAGDGVWDWDAQSNLVFFSPQWKAMLGYGEAEIGDTLEEWASRVHPADFPIVMEVVNEHLAGKTPFYQSEHRVRCKDGSYKWILDRGKVIEWTEDRKPRRVIGTHKDVTERKQAEQSLNQSEKNYHSLIETLDVSLCRWLPDTTLTYANEKYKKIFGISGDATGQKWLDLLPEETRATTAAFYGEVAVHPRTVTYEHSVIVEEGVVREYQWIDTPIFDEHGELTEFQSVGIDISDRKWAEEALRESEALLREAQRIGRIGHVMWTAGDQAVVCSDEVYDILGLPHDPSLISQEKLQSMLVFIDKPPTVSAESESANPQTEVDLEYAITLADGRKRWLHHIGKIVYDQDGKPLRMMAIIQDISEQKLSEELITAQRDLARLTVGNLTKEEIGKACLQIAMRLSGLDCGGLYLFDEDRRSFELAYHEGVSTEFARAVMRMEEGTPGAQIILSEKTLYFTAADWSAEEAPTAEGLRSTISIPLRRHGKILGRLNLASHVFSDIPQSSRKVLETIVAEVSNVLNAYQAEGELQASHEQLTRALRAAHMGTWRWHIPTNRLVGSPEAARIFGSDKLQGDFGTIVEYFSPDDRLRLYQAIRESFAHKKMLNLEYRILTADGRTVWVTNYGDIEYDREGKPQAVIGLLQDITTRKQMEEQREVALAKFRESNETAQAILNASTESVFLMDLEGKVIAANQVSANRLGKNVADLIGVNIYHLIPADVGAARQKQIREVVAKRQPIIFEDQHFGVWLENSLYPIFDQDGEIRRLAIYGRDITERKQVEAKLLESEGRFKQIANNIGEVFWMFDHLEQKLIYVNPAYEKIWGRSIEETYQNTRQYVEAIHPEDRRIMFAALERQARGERTEMEYRVVHVNGSVRWIYDRSFPIYDAAGKLVRTTGIATDFTDRKQAEEKLRESDERFRALFESSNAIMLLIDPDSGSIAEANPAAALFYGYSCEQLMSMNIADINQLPPAQVLLERQRAKHEERNYFIFPHRLASGEIRTVEVRSHPITSNKQVLLFSIIYDITESVLNQKKLSENQFRMEMALKGANAATWDWNLQTGATVFNERWAAIVGYTLQELEPISISTWSALSHPDDLKLSEELLQKHFAGETEFYECEVRMRHKSGAWVWVIDRGKVMEWDTEGKPLRMFGTHLDITERKWEEKFTEGRLQLANLSHESYDLDTLLRLMLDKAEELTESQIAFFHFIDKDQNTIQLQAWSTNTLATLCTAQGKGQHYPIAQAGIWADGVRDGEPCIYNDYSSVPNSRGLPEGHAPVVRFISLPIKRNNKVVAALGVGNKARNYDDRDLEIVQRLAEDAFDIVLRKRAEENLRSSEEKYRGLIESLDSVISVVDYEGNLLYTNDVAARLLGLPVGELLGKNMYSVFPREYVSAELEFVRQVFRDDAPLVREMQFPMRSGLRWFYVSYQPIHRENGEVAQVLINATDINTSKLIQQELQDLNNTLEAKVAQRTTEVQDLYDSAPTGYHSLDAEGKFVRINQTELNWLGYSREEILGHSMLDFVTAQSAKVFQEAFTLFKQNGKINNVELEVRRKDGSIIPVLVNAVAVFDGQGTYLQSRSTMFDNTERKKVEEALRESYDRLTVANIELTKAMRIKDEFLASMSHELRTPLTGILGLSEALSLDTYGELTPKQKKTLTSIRESGQHLLSLINDVLDLSKIEAGKLEIQTSLCSLADICKTSLQLTKGMVHQKHQQVTYTAPLEPIVLNVDMRRIKQMVVNLLSNAIKFTPENGELGLIVEPDKTNQQVRLIVWDKGIGIKPTNLSKLFQPFTQIDSSLAREYSGTGLGLSLVKRLAELHNGTVTVESVFGEGSRFTVTLPWLSPTESTLAPLPTLEVGTSSPTPHGKVSAHLILITDDNQTLLDMLADFLEAQNYRTAKCASGQELLAKIADVKPDLILMDIQMPNMDGLEVIRLLRQHPAPAIAAVPIIAVTALAMSGDRERCLEAGATDYISKPVRLVELSKMIEKAFVAP